MLLLPYNGVNLHGSQRTCQTGGEECNRLGGYCLSVMVYVMEGGKDLQAGCIGFDADGEQFLSKQSSKTDNFFCYCALGLFM